MTLRFAVLFGSMRSDRAGIRAARFILEQLRRRGHEPTLVDPLECQLPLLDRMYKEYPKGEAPEPSWNGWPTALPRGRRLRDRRGRVQPQHPAGA